MAEEFSDGCHGNNLGFQNGTIFAILMIFHVALISSIKFLFNLTYH